MKRTEEENDGVYRLNLLEKVGASLIKMGPMPRHIAIILDGNRRFARKMKLGHVKDGHAMGLKKLFDVAHIFLELGIQEFSTYVFSIENFKRAKEEVDGIMDLLAEKIRVTDANMKLYNKNGICFEFVGNLEDTPRPHLKNSMEDTMILTKNNKRIKINMYFIYTGRNEITKGVEALIQGLSENTLESTSVSEELLHDAFNLHPSYPVDILLRTSGECRLSDFHLWASSDAYMEFVDVTWPEFSFWGVVATVFRYQNQIYFKGMKEQKTLSAEDGEVKESAKEFLRMLRTKKWSNMHT